MHFLEETKKWLGEITEIALLLIALGVAVEILFGDAVPFFGRIITNLTALLSTLGDNGLVGLVALGIILFLFQRRRFAPQHQ
jgi:ABC-type enterochelin transport system permease subunit